MRFLDFVEQTGRNSNVQRPRPLSTLVAEERKNLALRLSRPKFYDQPFQHALRASRPLPACSNGTELISPDAVRIVRKLLNRPEWPVTNQPGAKPVGVKRPMASPWVRVQCGWHALKGNAVKHFRGCNTHILTFPYAEGVKFRSPGSWHSRAPWVRRVTNGLRRRRYTTASGNFTAQCLTPSV